jgi:hypothetical protein
MTRLSHVTCCCIVLLIGYEKASANICVFETVTVSQLRGHANYILHPGVPEEPAGGVRVQVEKRNPDGEFVLIAAGETNSAGDFFFPDIPSGSYWVRFVSPGVSDAFPVRVRGASLFHWFPNNWLQIGLGFVQPQGCPPSYLKGNREKHGLAKTAQPAAGADR